MKLQSMYIAEPTLSAHDLSQPYQELHPGWYRMPEREAASTPLKPEWAVWTRRLVMRAGYYVSPADMPREELNAALVKLLVDWTQLSEGKVRTLIPAIDGKHTLRMNDREYYRSFRMLYRSIAQRWAAAQKGAVLQAGTMDLPTLNLKTLWYVDLDELTMVRPVGFVTRCIGQYQAGYVGSDPEDYEPAYLDIKVRQRLYEVYIGVGVKPMYVHPLDVEDAGQLSRVEDKI